MRKRGIFISMIKLFLGANPAIRYNLLLFKEKSKRISTSIGAMAVVFIRRFSFSLSLRGTKQSHLVLSLLLIITLIVNVVASFLAMTNIGYKKRGFPLWKASFKSYVLKKLFQ